MAVAPRGESPMCSSARDGSRRGRRLQPGIRPDAVRKNSPHAVRKNDNATEEPKWRTAAQGTGPRQIT